jgi:hypothetical protein
MTAYIPSTLGEINDRLGGMVLCMPDMELPHTGLDMAGAYAQLEHSFGLVRKQLGDDRHQQLIAMARQSHQHFIDGQNKEGRFMLIDMQKLLRAQNGIVRLI